MNYKNNVLDYKRTKALEYAHKWAHGRNPKYLDFDKIGGDCTNFVSQALFAGCGIMNKTRTFGWYYLGTNNRTPSWTGVQYFSNFIINNKGAGPFGEIVDLKDVKVGDIVQLKLGDNRNFSHTVIIVEIKTPLEYNNVFIASHSYDRDYYSLTNYNIKELKFIHIKGVREK